MTSDRAGQIRDRLSKATPGPWKVWGMQVLADPVGTSNLDDGLSVSWPCRTAELLAEAGS